MRHEAAGVTTENFPPQLELGPNRFPLEYHFEPGSPRDGVTLTVPLALLNQVPVARTEWLVPGLLKEKLRVLAKAIPQRLRHKLGPLDEFVAAFCDAVAPSDTPLATALARYIRAQFNLDVPLDAFRPDSVPAHLRMNFRVVDETGRQRAMDRDLAEIKRALGGEAKAVLQQEAPLDEGTRYTGWTMGELPEIMEIARGGHTLVGYPALVDAGDAVTLQVFESPEKAREAHAGGVRRLLAIAFRDRVRDLERSFAKDAALAPLAADVIRAAMERVFLTESLPMTPADFARRLDEGRSRFTLIAQEIARSAAQIQAERAALEKKLAVMARTFPRESDEVKQQIARLLAMGWLARTPWERLQHLPRYLKAAALRLEKLRTDPQRDQRLAAEVAALEQPFRRELVAHIRNGAVSPELEQFGWLLEELRVSLFAQELRTPVPVSVKRLAKLWQSVRR
jgi:ATP-dependent helicase HrpA